MTQMEIRHDQQDFSTQTNAEVAEMVGALCADCALLRFHDVPCGLLRRYRLYREVSSVWHRASNGTLDCGDVYVPQSRRERMNDDGSGAGTDGADQGPGG